MNHCPTLHLLPAFGLPTPFIVCTPHTYFYSRSYNHQTISF